MPPLSVDSSCPMGCFFKFPKLLGPISGATIPFVSLEHVGSKPSNFAIVLVFHALIICLKDQLFKTSGLQFYNWHFGPEKFSGLSINRPQVTNKGPYLQILEWYSASYFTRLRPHMQQLSLHKHFKWKQVRHFQAAFL